MSKLVLSSLTKKFALSFTLSTAVLLLSSQVYATDAAKTTKATKTQYKYSYKVKGKRYHVLTKESAKHYEKKGVASWYGGKFHGRKTAKGGKYNMYAMTAASKELPLGAKVKVTNLANQKTVVLTINDRGPFYRDRIIDLSYVAAKKLGFKNKGTTKVKVTVINA